jgi:hypothetical protein
MENSRAEIFNLQSIQAVGNRQQAVGAAEERISGLKIFSRNSRNGAKTQKGILNATLFRSSHPQTIGVFARVA